MSQHVALADANCRYSVDDVRYFEADGSTDNPLRTVACSASYELAADGTVSPLAGPGLGVDVDEDFIRAHPVTEGPPGASRTGRR